jgi:outer membrane lipoprotein SlyB
MHGDLVDYARVRAKVMAKYPDMLKDKEAEWKDKIHGGLSDKKTPADFDSSSLREGEKVEKEHTSDKHLQKEIAMDHLTEDPEYYRKLKKMETKMAAAKRDFKPSQRTKDLEPYTTVGGPVSVGLPMAGLAGSLGYMATGKAAPAIVAAIAGGALGAGGMKMLQDYALKKLEEDGLSGKHDEHFEGEGFLARTNRGFMDKVHGHEGKIFGGLGALQGAAHGAMGGAHMGHPLLGAGAGALAGGAGGYVLGKSMEHRNSLAEDMMQHRGKTTHNKGYNEASVRLGAFYDELQKIAQEKDSGFKETAGDLWSAASKPIPGTPRLFGHGEVQTIAANIKPAGRPTANFQNFQKARQAAGM